jgi:hypothetical protein
VNGSDNDARIPWWADRPEAPPRTRRARQIRTAIGLGVAISASAVAASVILVGPSTAQTFESPLGTATRPSLTALAAGCGPQYQVTKSPSRVGTWPDVDANGDPLRPAHSTVVPVQGVMSTNPADAMGTTWLLDTAEPPPTPEQVLRSLWSGWMVAYVTADAPTGTDQALAAMSRRDPALKMLVVPWPTDRDRLPNRKTIALATWANVQECTAFSAEVVREFRAAHPSVDAPGSDGSAPPVLIADPPVRPAEPSTDASRR